MKKIKSCQHYPGRRKPPPGYILVTPKVMRKFPSQTQERKEKVMANHELDPISELFRQAGGKVSESMAEKARLGEEKINKITADFEKKAGEKLASLEKTVTDALRGVPETLAQILSAQKESAEKQGALWKDVRGIKDRVSALEESLTRVSAVEGVAVKLSASLCEVREELGLSLPPEVKTFSTAAGSAQKRQNTRLDEIKGAVWKLGKEIEKIKAHRAKVAKKFVESTAEIFVEPEENQT